MPLHPFHEFRNRRHDLKVALVAIDVPVYRMQNFRTYSEQTEYLAKEALPPDYFSSGQEVESVQQIQHEMLAKLADKGVSDSVAPIADVLKRNKQQEPLIITSTGVVVNGNRRLAAMRELFVDPSGAFPEFKYVECAVLPADATLSDVLDIEAGLQAKQETRLDYDWVGDAQMMNALVKLHGGIPEVAKRLNRRDKEIRNTIQALAEADIYLKEWAQSPGKYSLVVDKAKQLFGDIPKQIADKDPGAQQMSRVIAWTLFENRAKLTGSVYDYTAAFGRLAGDVIERVVDKLQIPLETADAASDGDFAVDFDDEATGVSYDALIEQLRDPETRDEVIETLIESAENSIEADKGQRSGQASLSAIRQAHAKLMAVDVSRAAVDTHATMKRQLEAIEQLARNLMRKLDAYSNDD